MRINSSLSSLLIRSIPLLLAMMLSGCVSTDLSSYRDPDFAATSFHNPIIFVATEDIKWRDSLESEIVKQFKMQKINASKSIDIAPPTKGKIDWPKLIPRLKSAGFDTLILIQIGDLTVTESYVPKTYGTTSHSGTISTYGNTATYSGSSYTPSYGGYSVSKPSAEIETTIFELGRLEKVWIASASTGGGGGTSFSDLRRSYARKLVLQLKKEEVFFKTLGTQ